MRTYSTIYADPPWPFKTYSAKGKGRSAEAWYDTMDIDKIKKLPITALATPDCVLLLWITDPLLPRANEIIEAWGFTWITVGFYWFKTGKYFEGTEDQIQDNSAFPIGTGYWTRANPEQCLLATRGRPKPKAHGVHRIIVAPRREHSRKPDEMYERIEKLCHGPYVELFARTRLEGWDVAYSDEANTGPRIERRWSSTSGPQRNTEISEIDL